MLSPVQSRRLVALACYVCAPAAFADDPAALTAVPVMPVEVRDLPAADDSLGGMALNLSLPSVAAKTLMAADKAKGTKAAALKLSSSSTSGPVVLGNGPVALDLTVPGPQNLSSGATLKLNLPVGALQAIAEASIGKEDGKTIFWHKDRAQVTANLPGPLGTTLNVAGENRLSLTYRAPESVGSSDDTAHAVRTETSTGRVSLSVPLDRVRVPILVTVGGDTTSNSTQEGAAGANLAQSAVRTADHAASVKGEWQPLEGVTLEGGAAARVASISWQNAHSSTYRSVDPNLTATVTPFRDTKVTAKVEQFVAPYDAAAFASYARADKAADASGFQPDHAWQVETRIEQRIGPASVSATYTVARQGTVTEFAEVGGVQAPVATPLLGRDCVAVAISMPLAAMGLPHTDLTTEAKWQTSRVVDPVTLQSRNASGEPGHQLSLRLAHQLPVQNLSIGLTGEYTGERTAFQVNELSATSAGGSVGAFLAYRPGAYELDLNVGGLYGASTRDDFYRGARGASLVGRTTAQDNSGPVLQFSLKKPF